MAPWIRSAVVVLCMTALAMGCDRAPRSQAHPSDTAPPPLEEIVAQLEGHHCPLGTDPLDACAPRPPRSLFAWLLTRHEDRWTCPTGAARCLAKLGPAARPAVPAMLRALASGAKDHDTGDGVIPLRSSLIEALGRSGDVRVVDPVADLLPEPSDTYAALQALEALGPLAAPRAQDVVNVLRARAADEEGRRRSCERAVKQLDDRLAVQAVASQLGRESPEETRFVIPPEKQAAALAALDRTTQRYQEDREGHCRDLAGDAAVVTLAAMRCDACREAIVEALATPEIALQAAWSLGGMTPLPPGAERALRRVVASERHGPLAKRAAQQLLARNR
ncbi:MAG: hypothetical protein RL653_3121 [Pseudomonadota bacterium]|jgi:hypothetical protein